MADLWCGPCDQCHQFTGGELERVVYALVLEAEARVVDARELDDEDGSLCLEELLTDSEGTVRVDAAVESRRGFARLYGEAGRG